MARIVIGQVDGQANKVKLKLGFVKRLGAGVQAATKRVGTTAEEVFQKHLAAKEQEAKAQIQDLGPEDDDLDEVESEMSQRERTLDEVATRAEGLAAAGYYAEAQELVGSLETILRVTRSMEVQASRPQAAPAAQPVQPVQPTALATIPQTSGMVKVGQINPMILAQHGPGAYGGEESWASAMSKRHPGIRISGGGRTVIGRTR